MPILEVETQMNASKKNNVTDILFPSEFAGQTICFLIGDEIAYFTADARGIVTIKAKELVKAMSKR